MGLVASGAWYFTLGFIEMKICFKVIIALLSLAFTTHMAHAIDISGRAKISDGDTIEIGSQVIRLHGIDTPETGQRCALPNGKTWPCGKAALEYVKELVADTQVRCTGNEFDEYSRLLAICETGEGLEINRNLVDVGLAWAFVRFSDDYVAQERDARAKKIGVWQYETDAPWKFREARWQVAQQTAPDGCPIKGNISRNGQIYHTPWSRYYNKTKISLERGEKWFCSEDEALKAGWRAPFN
uniref:thermonuclease family protein n=1 Tax=Pararhizobium sp. IMCC3301 TaxID=3067904 RepID=UPI002740F50D|nr:thermonuclease family protein [Pararhizobium sp. IMCC3301]